MKKIVLLPVTDTVILCLPTEWIGVPVICKLEPVKTSFMTNEDIEMELERSTSFLKHKRKTKKK